MNGITAEERKVILEMYGIKSTLNEDVNSKEGILSLYKRWKVCTKDSSKYPNLVKAAGGSVLTMWGFFLIFIGVTGEFLSFGLSTPISTTAMTAGAAASTVGIKNAYQANYDKIGKELELLSKCINS